MQKRSVFLEILVRRFQRAGRRGVPRLPEFPSLLPLIRGQSRPARPTFPSVALLLLVVAFALTARAAVRDVGPIGLTVGDLNRELYFYTNTLPFELVSIVETQGAAQDARFNLKRSRLRVATLKLGDERITLTQHEGAKSKPIPADSRSFDMWFQHIAIVVRDMDAAYARLLAQQVKHVSTAPQTLPDWNKDAGGIKAFYFRDPEDHVLEIIWFPPGKGDARWQRAGAMPDAPLFLGIDHTAIVVSDTERSLAFYRDLLGFRVAGGAHNYGPEQEHLNQVFGARLRITALRAERGLRVEFLEYIAPPGGRALPADAKASDLIFWKTTLRSEDWDESTQELARQGGRRVSRTSLNSTAVIVRDPDGHALELEHEATPVAATAAR